MKKLIFLIMVSIILLGSTASPISGQDLERQFQTAQTSQQNQTGEERAYVFTVEYFEAVLAGKYIPYMGSSESEWEAVLSFSNQNEEKYREILKDEQLRQEVSRILSDAFEEAMTVTKSPTLGSSANNHVMILALYRQNRDKLGAFLRHSLAFYTKHMQISRYLGYDDPSYNREEMEEELLVAAGYLSEHLRSKLEKLIDRANELIDATDIYSEEDERVKQYESARDESNIYLLLAPAIFFPTIPLYCL